uniref:PCMD domain-containing protein n=1 Tax=Prevotella sp. TaxID=59823 RepID=UPI0040272698
YSAKLVTHIETCKVLGIVNIKVLAAGSIYLGQMLEPITSTSNPMAKLDAGMRFTARPKALMFDYKVKLAGQPNRIKETGFSKVKTVPGIDMCDCICLLQKRWEDAKGNLYAKRVGTMVVRFDNNTNGWVEDASFPIHYGDITHQPFYKPYMGLITGDDTKWAKNSKGKMVPVKEIGWAHADDIPTHLILQFDSSHGGAYIGSIGNTLWVDNVRMAY